MQNFCLKCVFHPCSCIFQDLQTEQKAVEGNLMGNLYILKNKVQSNPAFTVCNATLLDWHTILGHVSYSTLQHLPFVQKHGSVDDVYMIHSCEICFKGNIIDFLFHIVLFTH